MPRFLNPPSMPEPMSRYSQAVVVGTAYKRVIISAQVGTYPDGTLAEGLEAQIEQALENLLVGVAAADLTVDDLVRVTAYCTVRGSVALYRTARDRKFGKAVPAATYLEVAGLASPAHLVQIDGEALREAPLRA